MKNIVTLGHLENKKPLHLDINKLIQSKLALLGASGSGKTYTLLTLLERTRGMLPHIIIDPEGEFTALRRNHDYVLASVKGGDVLAHVSLAEAIAKRQMEENFNLIVDLSEMEELDRQKFVRLYNQVLIDAPRTLWRPKLYVLDEAQDFAPEKGGQRSVSLPSCVSMAKKCRKRKIGLVIATPRPADLSKAVTSQCGNKLVGVAYQDHDRKRAAYELGFSSREEIESLRMMQPGQFYAYGPALGYEVKLAQIDMPTDRPDEAGKVWIKPPAPSKSLSKILTSLSELPKEAQEEARTIADFKAKVNELTKKIQHLEGQPTEPIVPLRAFSEAELNKVRNEYQKKLDQTVREIDKRRISDVKTAIGEIRVGIDLAYAQVAKKYGKTMSETHVLKLNSPTPEQVKTYKEFPSPTNISMVINESDKPLKKMERQILSFLLIRPGVEFTEAQIARGTGYKQSGGFGTALSILRSTGAVKGGGQAIALVNPSFATNLGLKPLAGNPVEAFLANQKKMERIIYDFIQNGNREGEFTVQELADNCHYQNSGGFGTAISNLCGCGMLIRTQGKLKFNQEVFDL